MNPFQKTDSQATLHVDVLGSVAFTPVKTDIMGNVKKIRDRQLAAPADSETLQSLVVNELKTKKHTATEGLLWLVRYSSRPLTLPSPTPSFAFFRFPPFLFLPSPR